MLVVLLSYVCLAQPVLDLPAADDAGLHLGAGDVNDADLVRGLQSMRLAMPGTVIGSYGQFNLEYAQQNGRGPIPGRANVRRLVIFVSHNFSDTVRAYTEIEWEDAVACSNCRGAVEIEQGFVDWDLHPNVSLRTGLILIPMGIINQWHEPPVFHGVNRPSVDTWIIPTTWRELGLGVVGQFADIWRYELYATTAPDALGLGPQALRAASRLGSSVPANSYIFAGRLEVEPDLGVVLGASSVAGDLGDGDRYFAADRRVQRLTLPMVGAALDGRWRRHGLEMRTEGVAFYLPRAGALLGSLNDGGSRHFPDPQGRGPVPTVWWGAYAEVAYDVIRLLLATPQQLLPFARAEYYDTQARLPAGQRRLQARQAFEVTAGLSYRPIQQLVFKTDVQWVMRRSRANEMRFNGGVGYMF